MASSENQGLQIALIIFVMLTIILSVTTFVFFRSYDESDRRWREDQKKLTETQTALKSAVTDMSDMMRLIGVDPNAKAADVKATFDGDMKAYAATVPDEKKNYRQTLEYTYNTMDDHYRELVEARTAIQQEKDDRAKVEAAKQAQVAAAEAKQKEAEQHLADATAKFQDERRKLNDDMQKQEEQREKLRTELTAKMEDWKAKAEKAAEETKKVESVNAALTKTIVELDPTKGFETPDGEIVWVSQKASSVWINVGRADGLRRQITFSVIRQDENVGGDSKYTKGRIEVTEILGPHFAECRILEDKLSDPIVPGDRIFTPLWHPGRVESIGVVGLIDLDGDGDDDYDMFQDMVRMAGGKIDARVDAAGKQEGELTFNTRYLVVGAEPSDVAVGKWSEIHDHAKRLGVTVIPLGKFLDHMGWKDPKQTLRFGRKGNAEAMPSEMPDGGVPVSRGSVSGLFKKRAPPGKRESTYK